MPRKQACNLRSAEKEFYTSWCHGSVPQQATSGQSPEARAHGGPELTKRTHGGHTQGRHKRRTFGATRAHGGHKAVTWLLRENPAINCLGKNVAQCITSWRFKNLVGIYIQIDPDTAPAQANVLRRRHPRNAATKSVAQCITSRRKNLDCRNLHNYK